MMSRIKRLSVGVFADEKLTFFGSSQTSDCFELCLILFADDLDERYAC